MNPVLRAAIWTAAVVVVAVLGPRREVTAPDPPVVAPVSWSPTPTCPADLPDRASGVVRDATGPIPGVIVYAGDHITRTDADGAYTIDRPDGERVGLWGFYERRRCPAPGGTRWELAHACTLSLRVVGPDDAPIAAQVSVDRDPRPLDDAPLVVDADATLTLSASGMVPQEVAAGACEPAARTIRLERGDAVGVQVRPPGTATLTVFGPSWTASTAVETGPDGAWDLVLPRPWAVIAAWGAPSQNGLLAMARVWGTWYVYAPWERFGEDVRDGAVITLTPYETPAEREVWCLGVPDADCPAYPECDQDCDDAVADTIRMGRHTARAAEGQRVVWFDLRDDPALSVRGEPGRWMVVRRGWGSGRYCRVGLDGTCVIWALEPGAWRVAPDDARGEPPPIPGDPFVLDVIVPDLPGVHEADALAAP